VKYDRKGELRAREYQRIELHAGCSAPVPTVQSQEKAGVPRALRPAGLAAIIL
jgi:hypothetical protein